MRSIYTAAFLLATVPAQAEVVCFEVMPKFMTYVAPHKHFVPRKDIGYSFPVWHGIPKPYVKICDGVRIVCIDIEEGYGFNEGGGYGGGETPINNATDYYGDFGYGYGGAGFGGGYGGFGGFNYPSYIVPQIVPPVEIVEVFPCPCDDTVIPGGGGGTPPVTSVPEASTWIEILLGFVALGWIYKRKHAKVV